MRRNLLIDGFRSVYGILNLPGVRSKADLAAKSALSFVKLATVVESDQKAPFSIATTQRCRGGRYSFPWIAPLYPLYVPYVAEC